MPEEIDDAKKVDAKKDDSASDRAKTFTQDQVDKIVQERLARDRSKRSQEVDDVTKLQDRIDALEVVLAKVVTGRIEKLPKAVKSLVDKLDVADRLAWIEENAAEFAIDADTSADKKKIPPIPDGTAPVKDVEELKKQKLTQVDYSL